MKRMKGRKRKRGMVQNTVLVLLCSFMLNGCGGLQAKEDAMSSSEIQETVFQESEHEETTEEESEEVGSPKETAPEKRQEMVKEENGVTEIYADGDVISISQDTMTAQVSLKEILKGEPVIYDRFRADGWTFEWLISDCYDESSCFLEDGVLVISREGHTEDPQIIHTEAGGGGGVWVSAADKFEYTDVNFDGLPDLLICSGHHGNQGALTYFCFLQTEDGFAEAPSFTGILNPGIDRENQLILSQWRNWAASHSWAEYRWEDNILVMSRELCEEAVLDSDGEIWVWTVNGEEIGRSDELSEKEIEDLLYNKNSEWRLFDDRWRTLYNDGLMADYSIYSEP